MRNSTLNKVQGIVEWHIRDHRVVPVDLGAASAFMALSQSVTLGNKVRAGELQARDVPTDAPGEMMAMLNEDPDVLAMFRQIGGAIYSVASVGNKKLTFDETKGVFNINLGASEVVRKNPKLKEALDQIGYDVTDGESVQKVALATAWYWLFHRYQYVAERLTCEEAMLAHFTDEMPADVSGCLQALLHDQELQTLIS